MENVPSKPSAAQEFFLARVNFWYEHGENIIQYALPSCGGKLILGWVTFLGYVPLPSQGNFIQTDVVYPAWVWLPSKCCKHCICT